MRIKIHPIVAGMKEIETTLSLISPTIILYSGIKLGENRGNSKNPLHKIPHILMRDAVVTPCASVQTSGILLTIT